MVSKNNQWQKRQKEMQTVQHFGIRKLTVGVSSVLLGLSFMGMAATNVKADTVSGSQATNVAAEQATDSAKKANNNPAPANDVQKGADQKSAAPAASQTQTVQVKNLQKAAATVPADSLKESKAVSAEPEAKEVDLQIRRDSGEKTNDWYPSKSDLYNGSWNRFGVEGSFVIPKDEIKGGNEIKLLTLGQTSDTGWLSSIYFEWLPDVIVDGKKIGTLTGSTQQNGYQQMSSATLYIKLVDDVSSFAGSDQFIRLNVSHAGVFGFREDLLPLGKNPNKKSVNTYTIMNGAQKGKHYIINHILNMNISDYDGSNANYQSQFNNANPIGMDSTGTTYFDPYPSTSTLNSEEQANFKNSKGQNYQISPDYKLPVVAVNFKNSQTGVSYMGGSDYAGTQGSRIPLVGSDGKVKNVTLDIGDASKYIKNYDKNFGDNLSIKDLLALNYHGVAYSKQSDGSLNMVVRAQAGDYEITKDLGIDNNGNIKDWSFAGDLLHYNPAIAMDPNPEQAVKNTINAIRKAGNIQFIISPLIGVSLDDTKKVGQTTTTFYDADGNFVKRSVNNDASKKFAMEGQTTVNIHYINGLTGDEIQPAEQHIGWPAGNNKGHAADTLTVTGATIPGYTYRNNDNNQQLDDRQSDDLNKGQNTQITKGNHAVIINGKASSLQYPENGTQDYDFILDPNSQKMTVQYIDQDDNNKVLESKELHGYSDKMVDYNVQDVINGYLQKGYKLISDETHGQTLQFDQSDNVDQVYKVILGHKHITVTPDQPQDNGKKLPDNPNKTFSGVTATDLNKTIKRTINVAATPESKSSQTVQTAHVTRTADVDEVTGVVTPNPWTTDTWQEFDTPAVPGYTPNRSEVAAQTVTHDDTDNVIYIVYNPNIQKGTVKYIDDDDQGKVLADDELSGASDSKSDYQVRDYSNQGYKVKSRNVPATIVFDHDDSASQDYEVHLVHQHTTVTPDHPKTPDDVLPDNPGKKYPQGVDQDSLNSEVHEKIRVEDPHTHKVATYNETLRFIRTADIDEVTGEITKYGDWLREGTKQDQGTFAKYDIPTVKGYTPHEKNSNTSAEDLVLIEVPSDNDLEKETDGHYEIKPMKVNHGSDDINIDVIYSPDPQKASISYIDDVTGKTLITVPYTGVTDQVIDTKANDKVSEYEKDGYKLADHAVTPAQITFDNDDQNDQAYVVHLTHNHTTVQPTDPKTPDATIPGTDQKYPHGVSHDDLNKEITRTINISGDPRNKDKSTKTTVTLTRTADVDEVTGKVTYGDWSKGHFNQTSMDLVPGYTYHIKQLSNDGIDAQADLADIPAEDVTDETPNEVFDVRYTPDDQSAYLNFVDDDSKTSLANWDQAQGKSDRGPISFAHATQIMDAYAKQGYQFVDVTNDSGKVTLDGQTLAESLKNLGNYDHVDNVDQIFTVHLTHGHTTVQPTDPKTPDDIIPGTDHHYPDGVSHDDLNRTVTRTITVNYPDDRKETIVQKATFTRTADVDDVTGKVTYGKWNRYAQQLAEFTAPSVSGYLPDIAVVEAATVMPDSDDLTVEINYHVDPAVEAARQARLAQSNAISAANQGHTKGQRNEAHQLPQTGNDHDGALIGLGIAGAMSMLGLAKTKRRHN